MAGTAEKKLNLSEAIVQAGGLRGKMTAAQIEQMTAQYKDGQITVDAESLLVAMRAPEVLVSLNKAGLSLDQMDDIIKKDDIREMTSFSAMLVYQTSQAGQSARTVGEYDNQINQEVANLHTLSAIYTNENRTIGAADFIEGIGATDKFFGKNSLVFGTSHIDFDTKLADRLKMTGLATPDFSVTQDLINRSVFINRDRHQGPLSVVAYPTEHGNSLNTFPNYSQYDPKASFDYVVKPGDTLLSVAARLQPATGGDHPGEKIRSIALLNGSADIDGYSRHLQPGQTMKIPIAPAMEVVQHTVKEGENLQSLTEIYNMASKGAQRASLVAAFNSLQSPDALSPGQVLNIPITNDGADLAPLEGPQAKGGKETTLYITEPYSDHHFATYGTAVQYAASVFPDHKASGLTIKPLNPDGEPDMNDAVDQLIRKGGDTDAVFSLSLSKRPFFDSISPEARNLEKEALEYYKHHAPNVLISAGNNFQDNTEQYSVMAQIGSRNAFVVGATQKAEDGTSYVAPYSSPGADFTSTPLIPFDGQTTNGTSFSAPTMATSAAQFNTWYGDRLSFEEIMYAGMLSTKIDLGDCKLKTENNCAINTIEGSVFVTNGAGLPHHARAGSGEIDLTRWRDNLDRLATLKQTKGLENQPISLEVTANDLVNRKGPDKDGVYHYDVQIPTDIMMGKMIAEAGPLVKVQIESPGGYKSYIGEAVKAGTHAATSAFAFEDYKAGDTLRIASNRPLDNNFRLTMQGQEPNSALGGLRNALQEEGLMLKPHSTYENGTLTEEKYVQGYFSQPVPERQLAALDTPFNAPEQRAAQLARPDYAP